MPYRSESARVQQPLAVGCVLTDPRSGIIDTQIVQTIAKASSRSHSDAVPSTSKPLCPGRCRCVCPSPSKHCCSGTQWSTQSYQSVLHRRRRINATVSRQVGGCHSQTEVIHAKTRTCYYYYCANPDSPAPAPAPAPPTHNPLTLQGATPGAEIA